MLLSAASYGSEDYSHMVIVSSRVICSEVLSVIVKSSMTGLSLQEPTRSGPDI